MEIPGVDIALVEQRRIEYLLDPDGKGGVFLPMGFASQQWRVFQAALLRHRAANQVQGDPSQDEWGTRYRVVGPLETPSGRVLEICTVWIVRPTAPNRLELLTAFPAHSSR